MEYITNEEYPPKISTCCSEKAERLLDINDLSLKYVCEKCEKICEVEVDI